MAKEIEQGRLLRMARKKLQVTNPELAERLGVEVTTLLAWLRPATSKAHRPMPKTARLLLGHIMREHKAKSGK